MISVRPLGDGIIQFVASRRFLGRNWYRTACYLVGGILVDTCMHHVQDEILPLIGRYNVDLIVNTHGHEDHIGNNAALQQRYGLNIYAHPEEIPFIETPLLLKLRPYQRFLFGSPLSSEALPVPDTVVAGNVSLQVIETPGHSPGHIALFDGRSGTIFAGDAYIGGEEQILRSDIDIYGVIASYTKLAGLHADRLCPGTGKVIESPHRRILEKISYLEEVGRKIVELHRQGMDEKRIALRLFHGDLKMRIFTTGHFSALNMVRAFLRNPRIAVSHSAD